MEIIFIYAGDPNNNARYSPYSITRNVYHRLVAEFGTVHYLDWCSPAPLPPVSSNTIIIGHPNYSAETPIRRLFQLPARAKILMFPFHHSIPEINLPFDDLARQADAIISITGPVWFDTIEQTPFAHWQSKMTRLDMAIDANAYPFVKHKFNPPGQRQFAYIGCDRPEKGVDLLAAIMAKSPYHLHAYGVMDGNSAFCRLPNVHYHGWTDTNPQWATDLCNMVDGFLNPSRSDANATVILEACAWGLPVALSPGSGYYTDARNDDMFYGLNTNDPEGCANLLEYINRADEAGLLERSRRIRKIIEQKYNWQRFCDTVISVVKKFI